MRFGSLGQVEKKLELNSKESSTRQQIKILMRHFQMTSSLEWMT